MAFVENLDFLNENSVRAFPLKEGLTGTSADGVFTIPDSFMVDLTLSATSSVLVKFYISRVFNFPESIIVELADDSNVILGTFTIITNDHTRYKEYYLAPSDDYVGANGKLVVCDLSTMLTLAAGAFSFNLGTAQVETRCVVPSQTMINRLIFTDEKGNNHSLSGTVNILARNNLKFRMDGDTVILDAGDGLGLNKHCADTLPCITTINNIAPDSAGNFTLLGLDCAVFTAMSTPPGLSLDDTCCQPCMACTEIDELTKRGMQVESDLLNLRNFINNLNAVIAEFAQTTNFTCEC